MDTKLLILLLSLLFFTYLLLDLLNHKSVANLSNTLFPILLLPCNLLPLLTTPLYHNTRAPRDCRYGYLLHRCSRRRHTLSPTSSCCPTRQVQQAQAHPFLHLLTLPNQAGAAGARTPIPPAVITTALQYADDWPHIQRPTITFVSNTKVAPPPQTGQVV